MDSTSLLSAVVFGAVGTGYALYGKKQSRVLFLVSGLALMVLPMVLTGWSSVFVCSVVTAAPFAAGRWLDL